MMIVLALLWLAWAILYDDNQRAKRRRLEK